MIMAAATQVSDISWQDVAFFAIFAIGLVAIIWLRSRRGR